MVSLKMRFFLFILLLLIGKSVAVAAAPFFEVRFSRPLAVYYFVEALSGSSRSGTVFQKQYIGSRFETAETRAALADFDTLDLQYSYAFPQYPAFSKTPGQTEDLLRRALLLSTDLTDFRQRAAGIVPKEDLTRLLHILTVFKPVYDSMVYVPLEREFHQQLSACASRLHTPAVSEFFRKMSLFHGQEEGPADTFRVAFYPLPRSRAFQATAFIDCSVSALPEGERDYDMLLSVTLHEIAHILYNDQPLALKQRLQKAFANSPFPGAANARLLFNEAQATALGNGAAYLALTGVLDTGAWYSNKYRNGMAKAIYPMVAGYLSRNQTIDSAFVAEYCRIYATRFPEWEGEAAHLFTNRFVVADDDAALREVRQAFPVTSTSYAATPLNEANLKIISESLLTKVLVLNPENAGNLALAKRFFPQIRVSPALLQKGFVRSQNRDGTWLYVLFTRPHPLRRTLEETLKEKESH